MGSTGIHQLPSSEPQLLYLACSQIRDPKTRRCLHIIVTFLYLILQPLILTFTRTYDLHPALRHIHPIIYPLFSPKFKAKETSGNQSAGNGPGASGLGAGGGGVRGRGRRSPYQSFSPQPLVIGLHESGSLKRSGNFMSHSVRF